MAVMKCRMLLVSLIAIAPLSEFSGQVFVLISDVMCNNISIRTSHPPADACVQPGSVIFPGRPLYLVCGNVQPIMMGA